MAPTPHPRRTLVILVVIVVAAAGIGLGLEQYYAYPSPATPAATAQVGDNVTVNYIGQYANGSQAGRTFDTSLYAVYLNNVTYPKSLQYTGRGTSPSDYSPLPIHIGGDIQYTVDGVNYTPVVTGFSQGVVGLQVNQTRWVTFPDSLGYFGLNPACVATVPLTFSVPVLTTVAVGDFSTDYPGVTASPGLTFPDPTYGWTDLVFSMNTTDITVESLTTVGFVATVTGWNATVTQVNATAITLHDDITPANYASILGHFATARACGGGQPSSTFTILSLNLANGTFVENWNSPVAGFSLTFRITLVSIVAS
jgi:hypothetical protein